MSNDTGSVITVDGPIDPTEAGVTLPHEHTFFNWFETDSPEPPTSAVDRRMYEESIALENLWYIHRNSTGNRDNLLLGSLEEAIEEVRHFRRAGGDTIVDVTPKGVGADPTAVRAVGRESGLNFVHGTAYYTRANHPDRIDDASVADLTEEFVSDVKEGIDDTDVRAGIIGEIGLSGDIHDQEEKVLRAGARAAARTGAPLTIHPPGDYPEGGAIAVDDLDADAYPASRYGLEVLDIVE